jgi:hypothetical protein
MAWKQRADVPLELQGAPSRVIPAADNEEGEDSGLDDGATVEPSTTKRSSMRSSISGDSMVPRGPREELFFLFQDGLIAPKRLKPTRN